MKFIVLFKNSYADFFIINFTSCCIMEISQTTIMVCENKK